MQHKLVRHAGKWKCQIGTGRSAHKYSTGLEATGENKDRAEALATEIARQWFDEHLGETCREIMDAYLVDMANRTRKVIRIDTASYAAKAVIPFFGDFAPNDITRELCRRYVSIRREQGKSDTTIRQQMAYLKAACNWRDKHNTAEWEFPSPNPPMARHLTRDEFRRYLEAADAPHIRLFMQLAIATAARKEALLQLQWDTHINFDRREVWLGFKLGGKGRGTVAMNDQLYEALKEAKGIALTPYVIEYGQKPVTDVRKGLRNAVDRAGLENVRHPAHVLRHSAGVWMAEAGVSMERISQFMGHSSIHVTERVYARFSPESTREVVTALAY